MHRISRYLQFAVHLFLGTTLLAERGWAIGDDTNGLTVRLRATVPVGSTTGSFDRTIVPGGTGEVVGMGYGRIHVIPTLSSPSVKNGEKLVVSAVVKAEAGVAKVEADLGGVETIALRPAPRKTRAANTTGGFGVNILGLGYASIAGRVLIPTGSSKSTRAAGRSMAGQ